MLSTRTSAALPFYCSFGPYCDKMHKVSVKCPSEKRRPRGLLVFGEHLWTQGCSHLCLGQELPSVCVVFVFSAGDSSSEPSMAWFRVGIWGILILLSQQSPQMLHSLPAKVSILQPFPLKLFHFVSTFEYSLGEELEGDAPTLWSSSPASSPNLSVYLLSPPL